MYYLIIIAMGWKHTLVHSLKIGIKVCVQNCLGKGSLFLKRFLFQLVSDFSLTIGINNWFPSNWYQIFLSLEPYVMDCKIKGEQMQMNCQLILVAKNPKYLVSITPIKVVSNAEISINWYQMSKYPTIGIKG
jgi:hypothetical protein